MSEPVDRDIWWHCEFCGVHGRGVVTRAVGTERGGDTRAMEGEAMSQRPPIEQEQWMLDFWQLAVEVLLDSRLPPVEPKDNRERNKRKRMKKSGKP